MATIEISVTHKRTGQVKVHHIFDTTNELAQTFIEKIEEMIAHLPPKQVTIVRSVTPNEGSVIDIEVGGLHHRPLASPTFEEKYRRWRPPEMIEVNHAHPYQTKGGDN